MEKPMHRRNIVMGAFTAAGALIAGRHERTRERGRYR
jgi:hypothetical protein